MADSVPGFVPRLLSDPTVGLFRADERVFDAMLDGWRAQMLARGLTTETIGNRCRLVRRFQTFSGEFPWQWRPVDIEDFLAERRSGEKPISLTTLRSDSNSVAMFCAYLTHPAYGWTDFCERTFGDIPSQSRRSASTGIRLSTRPTMPSQPDDGRSPKRSSSNSLTTSMILSTTSTRLAPSGGSRSIATRSPSSSATPTVSADASSPCWICTTSAPTRMFLTTACSAALLFAGPKEQRAPVRDVGPC